MGITRTGARALQQRKPRANEFTLDRQQAFLTHFASSCNVRKSAAAVGIAATNVYARRLRDPEFRAAWSLALDQGIFTLRSELVCRGIELLQGAAPDDAGLERLAGMDARMLLALVSQHEKTAACEPGDVNPQRTSVKVAVERLEKLLIRLKAERAEERARARVRRAARALPPPSGQ